MLLLAYFLLASGEHFRRKLQRYLSVEGLRPAGEPLGH